MNRNRSGLEYNPEDKAMDVSRREALVKRLLSDMPEKQQRRDDGGQEGLANRGGQRTHDDESMPRHQFESLGHSPQVQDLEEPETKVNAADLRKARLQLLAANIWAKLGDPEVVVQESDPNEITIKAGDLSWVLKIGDDQAVTISGFDSGVEQYLGKIPEENSERALIGISNNILELIGEDIEESKKPPEPPIHFGPEDEGESDFGSLDDQMGQTQSPETMNGDMGSDGMAPPEGGMGMAPPEGGMGMTPDFSGVPLPQGQAPAGQESLPMPGAGMAPPPAPMGAPPPAPMGLPGQMPPPAPFMNQPQQQGAYPMMPAASRRRSESEQVRIRIRVANKRIAVLQLDSAATELQRIGEVLEEGENGPFKKLAERLDRVTNTINQCG